jgi:hypothetical protein
MQVPVVVLLVLPVQRLLQLVHLLMAVLVVQLLLLTPTLQLVLLLVAAVVVCPVTVTLVPVQMVVLLSTHLDNL